MSDSSKDSQSFDFDQMELKSDIPIHRPASETPNEPKAGRSRDKTPSRMPLVLVSLLFLAAAGAAYYFFLEAARLGEQLADSKRLSADTQENLTVTHQSLAQSEKQITTLTRQLGDAQAKLAEMEALTKNLDADSKSRLADLKKREKALAEVRGKRDALRKELDQAQASLKKVTLERDSSRTALAEVQKEHREKQAAWEQEKQTLNQSYEVNLKRLRQEADAAGDRLAAAEQTASRMEALRKKDSEAGLALAQENTQLKSRLETAKQDRERLRRERDQIEEQLGKTKAQLGVYTGKLVPFSENVGGLRLLFREPLPDDVKFPRRQAPILVRALISDTGAVEKAFIAKDQQIEGPLAQAVIRAAYRYKFSPPTLEGKQVKCWHAFLIGPE
ncbi:hypothetical protein [Acanthopleuribacter pedis]|uniref:Uncharacterized protein n=1 Tax=Acanthopleuribacter pedis TaxID=442870 RepID=A0A8J7U1M9_9BACT|nr:hypothetical protein [Acanthopleuribacter pedis]MBO1316844.1 hypothetical protein [Acanthopleuribacter pedis]